MVLIYEFPKHSIPNDIRALDMKEAKVNNGNLIAFNSIDQSTGNQTVWVLEYLPSLKS